MSLQIIDCEQGSPEWFEARMGIPTASEFGTILTPGKTKALARSRQTYLYKLAGEILTGEPMEAATSRSLERGKMLEGEARDAYAFMRDCEPQIVGFIRNGDAGCSPDSLIGERKGLEIKIALPHIQIDRLRIGTLPDEHVAQVQGCIWLSERDEWDFVSYCPKLPPLIVRVPRDDGYIANLAGAVRQFNEELAATVDMIRRYGQPSQVAA